MFAKFVRLLPYARRHRAKLIAILVMSLAATATSLFQPWPMKVLVDFALSGVESPAWSEQVLAPFGIDSSPWMWVITAGCLTLVIFLINSALDVGLSWAWMATGQRMVYDLSVDTFQRLLRLSLSFHGRYTVGDYLSRLSGDTWCVYKMLSEFLIAPFQRLMTIVSIGVIAWMLDPQLTLVSFAVAPVVACSVWYFGPRLKQRAKRGREAQARVATFVHQTVTSIPLVQAHSAHSRNQAQFESLAADAVSVAQQGVLLDKSYALVNGLANSSSRAMVVFLGGLQVVQGSLTIGSLLVFFAYVQQLQNACTQLLQMFAQWKTSEASLDRLLEILDAEDVVSEPPDAKSLPPLEHGGWPVKFEQVTFGYVSNQPVLNGITIEIEAGENIALVGPSGSGKTTLVSLLARLHDPQQGRICIGGIDIREFSLDSVRSCLAIMLQESFLLPLSVACNIEVGRPGASREEVIEAARAASAHDFIMKLPTGYETQIGQKGSTLSGGQKQRLAIARAFIRNAPILILDEPTSALDVQTEEELLEALARLQKGRTTITIAHRLSTIRKADRILVLENGRIVESGTHAELLQNGQLYERFYAGQRQDIPLGVEA